MGGGLVSYFYFRILSIFNTCTHEEMRKGFKEIDSELV